MILVLILGTILLCVMTFRETRNDFALVFDRRLLRRNVKRFSIRALMQLSLFFAVWFAITNAIGIALIGSLVLTIAVFGFTSLLYVALKDLREPMVKHDYPAELTWRMGPDVTITGNATNAAGGRETPLPSGGHQTKSGAASSNPNPFD